MTKRFPPFSRMWWESTKAKPRLHPKMRERMWQPGQSGNPSGLSKADAELMRQMATQLVELSAGAKRTRRWRQRKRAGLLVVSVELAPQMVEHLVRLRWLEEAGRTRRDALAAALVAISERAIELLISAN